MRPGQIYEALAAIAMRHCQIDQPVMIKVCRRNRCGWVVRERGAVRSEAALFFSHANIVRPIIRPVGDNDVGPAIAVEIDDTGVTSRPLSITVGGPEMEMAVAIIQVSNFRIGSIIAEHDIQITIAVEVYQAPRIRAIGCFRQVVGSRKVTASVAEKDAADLWPMPSIDEKKVELSIAIQVTNAHIG